MKITVIGAGNMGGAIAEGAVRKGLVAPQDMTIADPRPDLAQKLHRDGLDVVYTTDNVSAVAGADLVIVAVKPWLAREVTRQISAALDRSRQVYVSIPAGIPFTEMEEWLDVAGSGSVAMCRVIPNTAIALGRSVTFVATHGMTESQRESVFGLFGELGSVFGIEEQQVAACTALSSSGIAYAFKYMEASAAGGVEMGLDPDTALEIVVSTVKGAVSLMEAHGEIPSVEIRRVATPGGLTEKGLAAMEENGFTDAVVKGLWATR